MRRIVVFALLVSISPLMFAQAYKWKDAQGVTHYADAPPTGSTRYETIKTSGTAAAPAPAPTPAPASTAAASANAAGKTVSDTPANRAQLCSQLRGNMDVLTKEKVVSVDDGHGGSKPLDTAARQRQMETTQAQMTLYCK